VDHDPHVISISQIGMTSLLIKDIVLLRPTYKFGELVSSN